MARSRKEYGNDRSRLDLPPLDMTRIKRETGSQRQPASNAFVSGLPTQMLAARQNAPKPSRVTPGRIRLEGGNTPRLGRFEVMT